MGAQVPRKLSENDFDKALSAAGLKRIHQGKVRDTYELPDHPDLLLLVATDRLSIFDFVLPTTVPYKGEVLTALTVFWLTDVLEGLEHHLVASGAGLDSYLPEALKKNDELKRRSMAVKKLEMLPVECVVRGYLTGSGWGAYKRTGEVCGHSLAEDLHDGSRLPEAIFTPTTKAEVGHDEHISFQSVREEFGIELENASLDVYRRIHEFSATRGIILADTKFEFGVGQVLADEVATPDSSRFWDREEWDRAVAKRRSPSGYDKQPVREWGKTVETPFENESGAITGINRLDTEDAGHIAFVHDTTVPEEVVKATSDRYRRIFKLLTGTELTEFQSAKMGL